MSIRDAEQALLSTAVAIELPCLDVSVSLSLLIESASSLIDASGLHFHGQSNIFRECKVDESEAHFTPSCRSQKTSSSWTQHVRPPCNAFQMSQ